MIPNNRNRYDRGEEKYHQDKERVPKTDDEINDWINSSIGAYTMAIAFTHGELSEKYFSNFIEFRDEAKESLSQTKDSRQAENYLSKIDDTIKAINGWDEFKHLNVRITK